MLPSNLLTVWKRKGTIQPRYAKPSTENLQVARNLIEVYQHSIGKKKSTLKKVADDLEDEGYDYHLVRGLSLLLDRRSVFKCTSQADPPYLRQKIFQATGKTGPATTLEQRKNIIEKVASQLKISSEKLEESMYADLESELILQNFDQVSAQDLLEKYNLSLAQTLLFDSTELRFTVSANWQKIFFKTKRLGLIYDAYKDNELWVKIDGPASLFKLTRRYGTAIAKLLPTIISSPKWTVEAKILWKFTNEIYTFKLESWKHTPLFGTRQTIESYDSAVEEDFSKRFKALSSGWQLRREPEPVIAGKHVLIPDFSFEREGAKLYMEVVGFWTTEYLLRKIEKLKKTKECILVAVDETLACERLTKLEKQQSLNIIYYRNKIPLPPVLRYLQDSYKEARTQQTEFLKNLNVTFTEPIIKFEEFAKRTGVSTEAVRAVLTEKTPGNYTVLPDSLIRKDKLEQIRKKLDQQIAKTGKLALTEAAKIAQTEQVDLTSAIQTLGYKIIWHGINTEKAEIIKPQNKTNQTATTNPKRNQQ
jgi:predicted nuclease of restriction endonuclease-like RecB superfamily